MIALHERGDGIAGGPPRGLIAEDHRVGPESRELGHRRHDQIVLELATSTAVERSGDQVSAHEIEWCRPASDPDPATFTDALKVVVVADGVSLVFVDVPGKVKPLARERRAREPPILIGRAVADRTGGQFDIERWLRAEWAPAATTESAAG